MSGMTTTKSYIERIKTLMNNTDAKLTTIQNTFGNSGFNFSEISSKGFTKTNIVTDLSDNVSKMAIAEVSDTPAVLGSARGYDVIPNVPLSGYTKGGVVYVKPTDPTQTFTETISHTLATDRADGDLSIERWTSRNIFKFTEDYFGYNRCMYRIPVADLANGIVIDAGNITPHGNTLSYYPYPEEIIMTSQKSEKNFIHFINVQYTDGHYGIYNGRKYNLMIVKDRIRYGKLNASGTDFDTYKSVYANNIETELAYYDNEYLYIPVPNEEFGEELIDTMWDCRVIWRHDAPTRNIAITPGIESSKISLWTEGTISSTSRRWYSVCYGKDKYVAVAYNSSFAYSTDGITWTEGTTSSTNRNWMSVCYGNDKFVAVDYDQYFAYSTDGITWTEGTISSDNNRRWQSICYGNGKFVTIGYNWYYVAYSIDGITWTVVQISSTDRAWRSVCYGKDKFVAIDYHGYFTYSTDGITWTEGTLDTDKVWEPICYGNDKFVTLSYNNSYFAYSYDGITWTESTISSTSRRWYSVCYGNDKFVAVAYMSNYFAYSTDGITWTESTISSTDRGWRSVCYGKNKFVAVALSTNYFAYSDGDFTDYVSFTNIDVSNDRIHLLSSTKEFVSKNRNSVTDFSFIIPSTKKSSYDSFVLDSTGNILLSPDFSKTYSLRKSTEHEWLVTGTPNQFFKISDNNYIGFYYYNPTNRGNSVTFSETDYETNLYWGLFNNTLSLVKPASTSDEVTIYPCRYSSSIFTDKGYVIKVFKDTVNYSTGISTFIVFTTLGVYKFTFTLANNDLSATFEEITTFSSTNRIWKAEKISKNVYWTFGLNDGNVNSIDVVNKTVTLYTNGDVILLGRSLFAITNTNSTLPAYVYNDITNSSAISISDGTQDINSNSNGNIDGRYALLVDSNSKNRVCKLVENYTFDRELDPPLIKLIWTEGSISDTSRNWYPVCYGNDKYVAVASRTTYFAYSTDGIIWIEGTISNTSRRWNSVCYGNDKFVALELLGYFAYSTDGITWTEGTINSTNRNWYSVCYGKDKFVAVANNSFAYSTDGITWTEGTISSTSRGWYSVCYGNDKFVAVTTNSNSYFAYSTDGITWTEGTISSKSRNWYSVCYGNDKFVAVAYDDNYFAYSTDGITWTEGTISNTRRYWRSVCYGNGKYVTIGLESNYFAYSTDGIIWTESTISDTSRRWLSVCYGKDKFVAVADDSNYFAYLIEI